MKFFQIITIIPFTLLLLLTGMIYYLTDFNKAVGAGWLILFCLFVVVLSWIFQYNLFEWGESQIRRNDNRVLELELQHAGLIWQFILGFALAFLIPGVTEKLNILIVLGLIFFSLSNVVYYAYYYPRYRFLMRKRLIELDLGD